MTKYKIHVYMVTEEPYDRNRYICIRRENLETGEFDVLRCGNSTWPEAIVKTLGQVGVDAALYEITEEDYDMNDWSKAKLLKESWW